MIQNNANMLNAAFVLFSTFLTQQHNSTRSSNCYKSTLCIPPIDSMSKRIKTGLAEVANLCEMNMFVCCKNLLISSH